MKVKQVNRDKRLRGGRTNYHYVYYVKMGRDGNIMEYTYVYNIYVYLLGGRTTINMIHQLQKVSPHRRTLGLFSIDIG